MYSETDAVGNKVMIRFRNDIKHQLLHQLPQYITYNMVTQIWLYLWKGSKDMSFTLMDFLCYFVALVWHLPFPFHESLKVQLTHEIGKSYKTTLNNWVYTISNETISYILFFGYLLRFHSRFFWAFDNLCWCLFDLM